ncbi:Pkinase-domain-containing protein [Piromyces finnis]|uniref:Pkinase-domain-containing protein n=1 Tax=Piromyces finnis TaxID=1754191 RepID=A0A1Y1V0R3_9FUNG|nr:Pkinase-domain-containing protein [Piromyces finnis]|eukprot:ORX44167.1 Pkinase-domain-containing protein [Piromyces finnis]
MGTGNCQTQSMANGQSIIAPTSTYYSPVVPIKHAACNIATSGTVPINPINSCRSPISSKIRPIIRIEQNRPTSSKEEFNSLKYKVKYMYKGGISPSFNSPKHLKLLNYDREEYGNKRPAKTTTLSPSITPSRHWDFFNTDHALNKPKPAPKIVFDTTPKREIKYGRYEMLKHLGTGSFATVHLAKDIKTGDLVAMKFIDKVNFVGPESNSIYEEIKLMKAIKHKNIVKLIDVIETSTVLCIVMEYCENGELYDLIVENFQNFTIDDKKKIFKELVRAVKYLHENNISHRDLKVENILLDKDNNVKLADFNLATKFTPDELFTHRCGSEEYTAPEIVTRKAYDPRLTDIWALGIILYAIVVGHLPFYHKNGERIQSMYHRIAMVNYKFPPGVEIDKDAKNLIGSILKYTPQSRATLDQILSHPWLQNINSNDKAQYNYTNSINLEEDDYRMRRHTTRNFDFYKFKSVNNYSYATQDNFRDFNGMYTLPKYNLVSF